jgi:hypothetical protein
MQLSAAAYKFEHSQQHQQHQQQMSRPSTSGSRTPTRTPPPGARGVYQHGNNASLTPSRVHTPSQTPSPSNVPSANSSLSGQHSRANADQLKTFLRKKACLYEVDTSRAISVVTWLVGRSLSCLFGHFTRQELQTHIHGIVSSQIDMNLITRTKVNRCMQIILNSCFHYVIPKPGGFDETSARFKAETFTKEVVDDRHLLGTLAGVWSGLESNFAKFVEETERSKRLNLKRDGDAADDPNTVLLCFNDNIRSANDVIFSHNEFIRDIAIANNLRMTPEDWRFFYRGTDHHVPRNIGINNAQPHLSHQHDVQHDVQHDAFFVSTNAVGDDECGCMSARSLANFRVSFCEKRYAHECRNCTFAHVEVGSGWLRRNPELHDYEPAMCEKVVFDERLNVFVNRCEHGLKCTSAHSFEEINFHPKKYKSGPCNRSPKDVERDELAAGGDQLNGEEGMMRCRGASMDICPFIHYDGYVGLQASTPARQLFGPTACCHHVTHGNTSGKALVAGVEGGSDMVPKIAPMLYGGQAPLSKFEETLRLPGLQILFRQNCASLMGWSAGQNEA